jgi:hypothetical protein
VRQLFGGSQHIVLNVERSAHSQTGFDGILASAHQVASGLPIPAAQLLEVIGIDGRAVETRQAIGDVACNYTS